MNIYEKILSIFFEQRFSKEYLSRLHLAAQHKENWIFSVFDYQQEKTRNIIKYLKKYNDFILKQELAEYMSDFIIDYLSDQQELSYFKKPLIIPVPISKKRLQERDFNQTESLAKYFAKNINAQYKKNIIYKQNTTKKQALIKNRSDRFKNVKNVFNIKDKNKQQIKNKDIIIIDDLVTTGATLMEIKKLLKKSGARNIIAVTIAH